MIAPVLAYSPSVLAHTAKSKRRSSGFLADLTGDRGFRDAGSFLPVTAGKVPSARDTELLFWNQDVAAGV